MRKYLLGTLLLTGLIANGQTKKTRLSLAGSRLLVKTIFETRDSLVLESLFAQGMKYHANGMIQSRQEAISSIVNNSSKFVQAEMASGFGVAPAGDSTVVKYFYKGRENKADGTAIPYTVNLVMVWVKEKKDMKLTRLETIKIE